MARLKAEFVERVEIFCDRVMDVAEAIQKQRRPRRIVDQIYASGTSVGANACEADEAISRPEFIKCLGISTRELAETRFWMRLIVRRKWLAVGRLASLQGEAEELGRILSTIIKKSRANVSK